MEQEIVPTSHDAAVPRSNHACLEYGVWKLGLDCEEKTVPRGLGWGLIRLQKRHDMRPKPQITSKSHRQFGEDIVRSSGEAPGTPGALSLSSSKSIP